MIKKVFALWKTIELGTGQKTESEFDFLFRQNGYVLDKGARDTISSREFTFSRKKISVKLTIVSPSALGFYNGGFRKEVQQRAEEEFGLGICRPTEIAPQVRLNYPEQPFGEHLVFAMNPIIAFEGNHLVFALEHNKFGKLLRGYYGEMEDSLKPKSRLIFVLKK